MRKTAWTVTLLLAVSSGTLAYAADCTDQLTEDSPVKAVIACIKEQRASLSKLQEGLSIWSSDAPATSNIVGSGDPKPPATCPPNYYVAGINSWGAPGATKYCIGCFNGIQLICRKLNVQ